LQAHSEDPHTGSAAKSDSWWALWAVRFERYDQAVDSHVTRAWLVARPDHVSFIENNRKAEAVAALNAVMFAIRVCNAFAFPAMSCSGMAVTTIV